MLSSLAEAINYTWQKKLGVFLFLSEMYNRYPIYYIMV